MLLVHFHTSAQAVNLPPVNSPVVFEQLGEEQGINRYISCIFEDHLGYLWFGAGPEGLYRYNGYEFEHYQYIVGDTTSLPQNIVGTIFHEDRSGNLWLASGGQITRYNRATNDFSRLTPLKKAMPWDTWASVSSVAEDRQGNIWLGSYGNPGNPDSGGLIRLDPQTKQISQFRHDPADSYSLISNCVSSLLVDRDGILWVGTCGKGVDRFVPDPDHPGGEFVHSHESMEDPSEFIRNTVKRMWDDGAGSIWMITGWKNAFRYIKEKDQLKRYTLISNPDPEDRISSLCIDQAGGVWIGTRKGLAIYDPLSDSFRRYQHASDDPFSISPGSVEDIDSGKDGSIWMIIRGSQGKYALNHLDQARGRFLRYTHKKDDPLGISSHILLSVLVDRNGILWIATEGGGLSKYDPNKFWFNALFASKSDGERQHAEKILALCLDHNDRLWIGTNGDGLYSYDRISETIQAYPYDQAEHLAPRSRIIYSIIEDPAGMLWIGGDSGLSCLNTRRMDFEHFWPDPEKKSYFGPNYIREIFPGSSGDLWIATMHGGLVSFDPGTREFAFHRESEENPGGVPASGLMCVLEDSSGSVWTGSLGGLFRYFPGKQEQESRHTRYVNDPNKQSSISADMVGDLILDQSGNLWIATGGGGLNKMDIESGVFVHYTTREGLLSNTITNLCLDGHGRLWLGSFSGLGMFDPLTEKCIVYDRSDGLISKEVTQGSGFVSSDGEIFFGSSDGINFFHPDSILNKYIPPVVISSMHLFEKAITPVFEGKLELKHHENLLTFEFAALNYTDSHKNQYRYRMIGLDPDTIFSGTRRNATYTNLKPGKYTFWVTGSNNDGVWNPQGTSLDILIHPPWSRTILAIFIYVLLFILSVLTIIRWRTRKLLKDRENLEQLVKERTRDIEEKDQHILEMDRMKTRFFTNISHEFRTPLTLIISPLEEIIARRRQGDPELRKLGVIQRNSQRLLSLVNQLLDLSKLDSGKLKLELVKADVVRKLKLSCASFLSLAEKNQISYDYQLPTQECICYFDSSKLDTIVINLLSNAFKYTPREGIVKLDARIEGPVNGSDGNQSPLMLYISVIDSGPGIALDKQKQIFDRFYQVKDASHSEEGGTGIGLSLTKELVELIHGEITVNSEPGEGSCFVVSIPLDKEHLKESEYLIKEEDTVDEILSHTEAHSFPSLEAEKPSKNSVQLLIVEDNEDLRFYLKEQLQDNYVLLEAATGDMGLKLALKHIPDIIISDVMMPGMDGLELCKHLKSNERTSHIPVILLTAKADIESRISGLETGADDYILKPFQIKELRIRIQNLIRQRIMLRERFGTHMDSLLEDIPINSYDLVFIRRVIKVVDEHLSDFEFDVKVLEEKTGMSHTQLYRKLEALMGLSPGRFIRYIRLKRASKMFEEQKGSVTHVAFEVGFGNLSYFAKCFKMQFGISPLEYSRQYD